MPAAAVLTPPLPWELFSHPSPGLRLRPATPQDVAALADLRLRVEARTYAHLGPSWALARRLLLRCSPAHLRDLLDRGDLLLMAELGRTPLGLAAAQLSLGGDLRLHSTYVEGSGHGIGRALTAARLEAARRLGIERVVADCFVGVPRAEARLRHLGMVEHGPRTASPTFPGAALSHWAGDVHTALDRVSP